MRASAPREQLRRSLAVSWMASLDAGPDPSAAGLRAGAERLGRSYASASAFGTFFGPGRYDGVAEVRDLTQDEGCSCFVYTRAARNR